jgi:nitroreductase
MDLLENIKSRRSIRKYLDIPVEWHKISNMLDAARSAPTAGNLQSWKFMIVVNKETIKKIADAALQQVWMETAPVVIVICSELNKQSRHYGTRGENLYAIQECAAAAMNLMLVANEQELATCWAGAFDEQEVQRILEMPDNARALALIAVGYADEKVPAPPKHRLQDLVYFETWGNKIRMEGLWPLGKHIAKGKHVLKVYGQKIIEKVKEKLPETQEKQSFSGPGKSEGFSREEEEPAKEEKKEKKKKKEEDFGVPTTDDLKKMLGK